MISDDQLDQLRVGGKTVLVRRDADPANDVKGIIVAWDDTTVLLRKQNRRVVKLDRSYEYVSIE